MTERRAWTVWLLAALLPIFAVGTALLNPTDPIEAHAHDAALHVYRGVLYADALAEGWLVPRYLTALNAGLGGPLFGYYPSVAYLVMGILHRFGVAIPVGWRLVIALTLVAASVGMFGLTRALWRGSEATRRRDGIALVCAAAFAYSPYLLRDLFGRGSPQGMALALVPWLLWAFYRLAQQPTWARLLAASTAYGLILLTHNVTAGLMLPVAALFAGYLALRQGWRVLPPLALALPVALALTAFHVLPFVAEYNDVQLGNVRQIAESQPARNPVDPPVAWPEVFDTGIGNNAFNQSADVLDVLILLLGGIAALIGLRRAEARADAALIFGLVMLGGLAIWLQTGAATWVWEGVPALGILLFRWRLLSWVALACPLVLGFVLSRLRIAPDLAIVGLIALLVGVRLPSLYPALMHPIAPLPAAPNSADAQAYMLGANVPNLSSYNEFLPRWRRMPFTADESAQAATMPIENLPPDARLIAFERSMAALSLTYTGPQAFEAALRMLYFPGFAAHIDGKSVYADVLRPIEGSGYIQLTLPAGQHTLTLDYVGTAAQRAGDVVSLISLLVLGGLAALWRVPLSQAPLPHAVEGLPDDSRSHPFSPRRAGWGVRFAVFALLLLALLKFGWIDPQTTQLRTASSCATIAGDVTEVSATFGGVRLCGYQLASDYLRAGESVRLTLYWQIDAPVNRPGTPTFAHLLGTAFNPATNNPLWGQLDKLLPADHPLESWQPGKLYRDTYVFSIDPATPPGEYALEIGWLAADGQRIPPVLERGDWLKISELTSLLITGLHIG